MKRALKPKVSSGDIIQQQKLCMVKNRPKWECGHDWILGAFMQLPLKLRNPDHLKQSEGNQSEEKYKD